MIFHTITSFENPKLAGNLQANLIELLSRDYVSPFPRRPLEVESAAVPYSKEPGNLFDP
jgi:hypothetical protein